MGAAGTGRELMYNDELTATQWALNSAVECHLHTVEVIGSNPIAPTINLLTIRVLSQLRCPEMSSCLKFASDFDRKHHTHDTGMCCALLFTDSLRVHVQRGSNVGVA